MIQFNLLPSVKRQYVKAQKLKHTVTFVSILVASISLALLVLIFVGVKVIQTRHSDDLSAKIQEENAKLASVENLDKILTVQNQLNTLGQLHNDKPVVTRLTGYIKQVTPANVTISSLQVDFDQKTMSISGNSDAMVNVNKFIDTLKFTMFTINGSSDEFKTFSEVVLSSHGLGNAGVSYTVTLRFDERIFSSVEDVSLKIPAGMITTRSQSLFVEHKDESQEEE